VALGDGRKRTYDSEKLPLTKMGKSLYAARKLPKGHVLRAEDIVMKSPGGGLPPYEIDRLVGKKLVTDVGDEQALTAGMVG
jgi:N-acetylneuraminate synthase/sialic acid synthase